jgi:HK97 family phage portal protein
MATFFDKFKSLINTKSQNTSEQYNRAIYNWLGNTIVWNTENDETYINDGYRKNATIYSIINLITKAASTIPYHIYEKVNDGDYKRYKALSSGIGDPNVMIKAQMLKKHALVELEHTDLHKLLERPNPAQSYSSWITEMIAFGKLTGNRYIYGIGPETGDNINKYTELYIMPSQIMEINSGGIMKPVESYTIEYNGTYHIPAEQMCHIKDFNPYFDGTGSHLYGQSPLKAGLRSMTTNNEATESGVKFLQNQTARGLLMSDEGDLNEVQAQQLKDKFRKDHQGSKKAGDIIITPKKLSWVNFGLNASDMSLIEQYNASIKDLCNIYNVPVVLLNNTESSTYNNVKEAKKALYQNCVIPELLKIQDELNRWLAPMYGDNICIEYDFSVIPELQEETDKVVDQMSKAWWLTPNEKRAAMSYAHDEDNPILDEYYIPANLIPASGSDIDFADPQPLADEDSKKKNPISNIEVKDSIELKASYNDYPQSASNNAKRMIDWREKYGRDEVRGGTSVGWQRASSLSKRESLSESTVARMAQFNRHRENATIDPKFKDTPWKDNGYVAWNLWGGTSGVNWAIKKIKQIRDE